MKNGDYEVAYRNSEREELAYRGYSLSRTRNFEAEIKDVPYRTPQDLRRHVHTITRGYQLYNKPHIQRYRVFSISHFVVESERGQQGCGKYRYRKSTTSRPPCPPLRTIQTFKCSYRNSEQMLATSDRSAIAFVEGLSSESRILDMLEFNLNFGRNGP